MIKQILNQKTACIIACFMLFLLISPVFGEEAGLNDSVTLNDSLMVPENASVIITPVTNDSASVSSDVPAEETSLAEISSISISPESAGLDVTETLSFSALTYNESGAELPGIVYTWESSNETVGTVDGAGLFTAVSAGTTTVSAANGTVSDNASVTVSENEITEVTPELTPALLSTVESAMYTAETFGGTLLWGNDVYLKVANDEGARFNDFGNDTFHILWTGGGMNAVHISSSGQGYPYYGELTCTNNQSGAFYVTETGGRQYHDEIFLCVAINGTIPDDFRIHITADGYQWTPNPVPHSPPATSEYVNPTLDEWFTKDDFIYGPQIWRPAGGKYPIFSTYYNWNASTATATLISQNMSDTSNTFMMMFVDLYGGILTNYPLRIQYELVNLSTMASFNVYGYGQNANEVNDCITSWTNSLLTDGNGPSGWIVYGSPTRDVIKVIVSPSELTLALNGKQTFTATAYDDLDREVSEASFEWTSSNQTVGTIDSQSGLFTPLSQGETEIRATTGGVYGSATVSVTEPVDIVLTTISVLPSGLYLYEDQEKVHTFTATGYDQFGDLFASVFTWSSSNETVCTVNGSTGVVELLKPGNAIITAQNGTVSGTADVTFRQRPDWTLNMNGTATSTALNRTQFIELAENNPASFTDNGGKVWEGVNLSVLVGLVDDTDPSAFNDNLAAGNYTIRVKSSLDGEDESEFTSEEFLGDETFVMAYKLNGEELPDVVTGGKLYWPLRLHGTGCQDTSRSISGVNVVEVYVRPQIQVMNISPASIEVWEDSEPYKIPVQAFDGTGSLLSEDDYILEYTWESSNSSVGTVNQSGYFSPVGPGITTVTASLDGKIATAEVEVFSSGDKIYVDEISGDFNSVQDAVDFSRDGDMIVVMNGTFQEDVFIDHPVTITSETASDPALIEGEFTVRASDVTISRLRIEGSVTLSGDKNKLENDTYSNLIVESNNITNGGVYILQTYAGTSNNTIKNNNIIASSAKHGIDIRSSNNNTICGNTVSANLGLYLQGDSGFIIADNTVEGASYFPSISKSTCLNNTFLRGSSSQRAVVEIVGSDLHFINNTIDGAQRYYAFIAGLGPNSTAIGNTIQGGTTAVVSIGSGSNTSVCFNHIIKLNASSCGSAANSTAPVTYRYNGSEYTGYVGNYWDDPEFIALDTDGNGIFDIPYGNDNYPLVGPYKDGVITPDMIYSVVTVEVTPHSIIMMEGDSREFTAAALDELGREFSGISLSSFVWSVSDESVGTVDENGLFSAKGAGHALITASRTSPEGTVTGSANVTVIDGSSGSLTFSVDDDDPSADFSSVADALLIARDGDTIVVGDGAYSGSLTISQRGLTLKSKNGPENTSLPGSTITVQASNVTIEGLSFGTASLSSAENCIVRDNIIGGNWYGVVVASSNNCTIEGNTVSATLKPCVSLQDANDNKILNNIMIQARTGIELLYDAKNNQLLNNTIHCNTRYSGVYGIYFNDENGGEQKNNLVSNNVLDGCYYGIYLRYSDVTDNILRYNTVESCRKYPLFLRDIGETTFYLNKFNFSTTTFYVRDANSVFWNTTVPVTYLYNGVEHTGYLGNYWKDYSGTDSDGDGVGDEPYTMSGKKIYVTSIDYHPVVSPISDYVIFEATTINVSPSDTTLKVGESETFTAEIFDQRGKELPVAVPVWSSSDPAVGVVDASTGYFEALSPGTVTVTAVCDWVSDSVDVTVVKRTEKAETTTFAVTNCTFSGDGTGNGKQKMSVNASAATVRNNSVRVRGNGFNLTVFTNTTPVVDANGNINATVENVVLDTVPVTADLQSPGNVSASVSVNLTGLPAGAGITTTLSQDVSNDTLTAFQLAAKDDGLNLNAVAYTMNIVKTNLANDQDITDATIHMAVSKAWVAAHGGSRSIKIIRFAEDGTKEVLQTRSLGYDGDMELFEAFSPNGLSVFGVAAASAVSTSSPSSGGGGGSSVGTARVDDIRAGETGVFVMDETAIYEIDVKAASAIPAMMLTAEEISLSLDSEKAPDEAYQYIRIQSYLAPRDSMEMATLKFSVDKDWLDSIGSTAATVKVYHYNEDSETWDLLSTVADGLGESGYTFFADTPSFSLFAITAEKGVVKDTTTQVVQPTAVSTEIPPDVQQTATDVSTPEQTSNSSGISIILGILIVVICGVVYRRKKSE